MVYNPAMEAAAAQGYRTDHPLTDGHTHIDQFAPDDIGPLLDRAREANVRLIIAAGVTLDSCRRVQTLAEAHPQVYAGVGQAVEFAGVRCQDPPPFGMVGDEGRVVGEGIEAVGVDDGGEAGLLEQRADEPLGAGVPPLPRSDEQRARLLQTRFQHGEAAVQVEAAVRGFGECERGHLSHLGCQNRLDRLRAGTGDIARSGPR